MATMTRIELVQLMAQQGMVPLFYDPDINLCKKVLLACYAGGARLMEFTNRGDFAHEVFKELSVFVREELPGMALGVGSLTDAGTASLYLQLGADFVVTPALREDIARVCNRRKVLWLPGCATLTEICQAEELGCEIVKLFPGGTYGPDFVKAIKGPQPWTSIMPTGGVSPTEDNLKGWFDAGVTCVGMGSKLIREDLLQKQHFDQITQTVQTTLTLIQTIRQK
ncbi:MAG: bifunctional 4-hydroxy-2-oxoglutarate aldolase/2-dehydro-3-deoxy-phosphogluconate aldolase [Lewinella sp.]|nr:bifunctional 4-hydroxy-2-oxoglutarate aldolase/2-dehydro-3-deoxy-phosphogluconate aldolase [Lewinella sp.]